MENHLYEMELAGRLYDDVPVWRLRAKQTFTIHGITIKEGSVTEATFDGGCEVINSWVFGPGEFRGVQLQGAILGYREAEKKPHYVHYCVINSCLITADRIIARRVDMNDVQTKKIKFFGAVGNDNGLIIRDVRYPLSVRQYNTTYTEYRQFIAEADQE